MPYPAQTDREQIVQTAQTLLERQGVDQLSLALVASTLNIKAPSLYRHVASKNALLKAVAERAVRQLFTTYAAALASAASDPQARLRAIFRAHRAFAHAGPQTYMLIFSAAAPEQRADPHMLVQLVLPIQEIVAELVGQEASLAALRGALALAHGFVMLELNDQLQRGGDLDAAFEHALDAYLRGLKHKTT